MKKNILILILAGMAFTCVSQTEKGRMMIDGSFNVHDSKTTSFRSDSIQGYFHNISSQQTNSFGLKYGFFIKDNLMLGIGASYFHSIQKSMTASTFYTVTQKDYTSNGMGLSLFARYYQFIYKNRLALFGDAAMFGNFTESYRENLDFIQSTTAYGLKFSPGLVFFAKKWLAFHASFGAVSLEVIEEKTNNLLSSQSQTNEKFLAGSNLGFSPSNILFGLSFYFGRPKQVKTTEEKKQ